MRKRSPSKGSRETVSSRPKGKPQSQKKKVSGNRLESNPIRVGGCPRRPGKEKREGIGSLTNCLLGLYLKEIRRKQYFLTQKGTESSGNMPWVQDNLHCFVFSGIADLCFAETTRPRYRIYRILDRMNSSLAYI